MSLATAALNTADRTGIEFDDRFGEHVVTHAEAMRMVGNIGQGLWDIIHFSQCRDVDWLSDQDDRPLVHTPRNLAQFLAVCAQRFGSAQPHYAMCEQCRNGDGIFQTCVREVSMRELAFFGGVCMSCAARGAHRAYRFVSGPARPVDRLCQPDRPIAHLRCGPTERGYR